MSDDLYYKKYLKYKQKYTELKEQEGGISTKSGNFTYVGGKKMLIAFFLWYNSRSWITNRVDINDVIQKLDNDDTRFSTSSILRLLNAPENRFFRAPTNDDLNAMFKNLDVYRIKNNDSSEQFELIMDSDSYKERTKKLLLRKITENYSIPMKFNITSDIILPDAVYNTLKNKTIYFITINLNRTFENTSNKVLFIHKTKTNVTPIQEGKIYRYQLDQLEKINNNDLECLQ